MANVTASMVKELRDMTGAGMMDCKNALQETDGDTEAAVDWLRKKGLSKAAKKSSRVAAEGLIGIAVKSDAGALVEINSETDFVARNDQFKGFVKKAAELALEAGGDMDKLLKAPADGGTPVGEAITELVAKIGANMSVRRAAAISVSPGIVAAYVHNSEAPELGKIGVLVALKSEGDKDKLAALGKQIAMHIAAAAPLALTPEHLSADVVERERAIHADAARQSGKPENVIEKMIEGRMRKFFEIGSVVANLCDRRRDAISKVLEKASKELGTPVAIEGFMRFQVGEGIEKEDVDFADEVKAMSGR